MAKVQIKMPEDFLLKLSRLGDKTDEILPKVLEAGGEVVLEKVRSNLQAVIGRDTKEESRSTGELVSALGVSPAKIDREGNYNVKVGFAEPRSDGRSNAMIANVLEYDIVAEIAEIGSGLSLNRPGIREMAGLAHRHMIDAVLVSDISRLCRDCGQTLRLEGKLKKQGVSIESMKGNPLPEYRRARIALGCIMK